MHASGCPLAAMMEAAAMRVRGAINDITVIFSAATLVMAASTAMMAVMVIAAAAPDRAFNDMLDQAGSAPHACLNQADHASEERQKPRLGCRISAMLAMGSMVMVHSCLPVDWAMLRLHQGFRKPPQHCCVPMLRPPHFMPEWAALVTYRRRSSSSFSVT